MSNPTAGTLTGFAAFGGYQQALSHCLQVWSSCLRTMTSRHSGMPVHCSGLPPLCWSSSLRVCSQQQPQSVLFLGSDSHTWTSGPPLLQAETCKLLFSWKVLFDSGFHGEFSILPSGVSPLYSPLKFRSFFRPHLWGGFPSEKKYLLLHNSLPGGKNVVLKSFLSLSLFYSLYLLPYLILRRLSCLSKVWCLLLVTRNCRSFSICRWIFYVFVGRKVIFPSFFLHHLLTAAFRVSWYFRI